MHGLSHSDDNLPEEMFGRYEKWIILFGKENDRL